jgi:hypothetical protein
MIAGEKVLQSYLAYWTPQQAAFIIGIPVMLWVGHSIMFMVLGLGWGDRELGKFGLAIGVTAVAAAFIPGLLPHKDFLIALCMIAGYAFIIAGYRHICVPRKKKNNAA